MESTAVNGPTRVIAYVDGFNLYFGMRSKKWAKYYWLDVCALSRALLKPWQALIVTKYFTSRISGPNDKRLRQTKYLEAIATLTGLETFYGMYQLNEQRCHACGHVSHVPQEKMTDVNIATEILTDAFAGRMDTAILISADSDLVGPILAVKRLFPSVRVIVAFPPDRASKALKDVATGWTTISRESLSNSQMSNVIQAQDGHQIERPTEWR